ncbi:MAG: hypothetical protein RJB65_1353 [Actinomycetota bacterium]
MLDHVFTDAIGALRDAFEGAFLERQPFEERFQSDVLSGDLTWETSYGLPGEGTPPDVVAHITLDWPAWSQAAYRQWYVDEVLERLPAIEVEVVFRAQNLDTVPTAAQVADASPETSPLIGSDRLERVGITMETAYGSAIDGASGEHDSDDEAQRAVEVTYEGLYELVEETLADGTNTQLDEHFGALGGWIASTLVRLADLR